MHPLACRGAVGYNQQANGRFALLWMKRCLRVDPQGQPPIARAAVPFSRANLPASYQSIRPRARSASARTAAASSSCVRSVMGTLLSPCMDSEGTAHVRALDDSKQVFVTQAEVAVLEAPAC